MLRFLLTVREMKATVHTSTKHIGFFCRTNRTEVMAFLRCAGFGLIRQNYEFFRFWSTTSLIINRCLRSTTEYVRQDNRRSYQMCVVATVDIQQYRVIDKQSILCHFCPFYVVFTLQFGGLRFSTRGNCAADLCIFLQHILCQKN